MNIKTFLLVPSILALTCSGVSVLPAIAQSAPTEMQRGMNKLNLTAAQKSQMTQLRQETQAQIEQVLTPEQRSQLQSLKQSGQKMRGGMKSLNLSEAQKQQMRQIKDSAKQKMQAILTPEQRQLMQQRQESKQSRQRGQQPSTQSQPVQPQ